MNKVYDIELIIDSLFYANKFRGSIILIKIGGSILYDSKLMNSLCNDIKLLKECGIKIVLVHGGSKAINEALLMNGIETKFLDGLRITPPKAMKIIEMVLCGEVNKSLVKKLNNIGLHAVGLSGSDNNLLLCDYYSEKHECVGNIKTVNIDLIINLLSFEEKEFDYIPVIAPIGVDNHGNSLNINADWAACAIASALKAHKFIYLTDQNGIYDSNGNVLALLSKDDLQELISNQIDKDGMLTKVKTILAALDNNISGIHILNGMRKHCLIEELFTINGVGTLCDNLSKEYVG